MPYIGTQPKDVRSFGRAQFDFTATQGQTDFIGADDDGKQLGYTEGQVQVYVNGILMDDADYNTSALGNAIYLTSAANLNDIITVVALQTDIPNSDYVPISGGTFSGDMNFSGDLTVGATAIHVDRTNNRLGVGTYSPARNLVVKDSTMSSIALQTDASGSTLADGFQIQADSNDAYVWNYEDTNILFGTNNYTRMKIDNDGRVTIPYQPMFQAWANSGGNQHFAGGTNPSFSVVSPNVGNHFNGTTFTAPVAGRYLFSYSILAGTGGSYGLIALNVNNSPAVGNQHWTQIYVSQTNDGVNAATQILQLAANDQVNLYIHPTYNRFYWLGYYSRFCGYLLG